MNRCKAFTLVELLVVIAIIAILAGMLLPAIQRARVNGLIASNTNNLRQIGTTLEMYSSSTGYGVMPMWKDPGVTDGVGNPGDDTEEELVTALGRLYDGGEGMIDTWQIFSCPYKPAAKPDTQGPQIDGKDDINHDEECSYSYTRNCKISDRSNKIIVADEGDGAGKGFYNWPDIGQVCLYRGSHVKMERLENPEDDCDSTGIYVEGSASATDTIMF
ncbi:MAG: type II secretion system protein [Planctomycetes bacterium]|nr:type II secretion system protein [Planctomycetota bacterium]